MPDVRIDRERVEVRESIADAPSVVSVDSPTSGVVVRAQSPSGETSFVVSPPTVETRIERTPTIELRSESERVVNVRASVVGVNVLPPDFETEFVEWATFDYTNVGANLVRLLSAGQVVLEITVAVLETFDGLASVKVGSSADPDLWLYLDSSDLSLLRQYGDECKTLFTVPEQIDLTISATGSTQGRVGLLYRLIG